MGRLEIEHFFDWLFTTTLQGSLVIAIILALLFFLRRRLPAAVTYALWGVLLVKLLLPWTPQSPASLYNLGEYCLPEKQAPAPQEAGPEKTMALPPEVASQEGKTTSRPNVKSNADGPTFRFSATELIYAVWFVGFLCTLLISVVRHLGFQRVLRTIRPVTDQTVLGLLEDCKAQMDVHTLIGIIETDKTKSPVLLGFVRPRILLPKGFLQRCSLSDLRYIFLHELGHVRRWDIAVAWLMTLLQALHWFNPLVWLAFYQMRRDRELACDALVLRNLDGQKQIEYGQAILRILEHFSQAGKLCSFAGVLEEKTQLYGRVKMISQFKRSSRFQLLGGVALVTLLALTTLTNAANRRDSKVKRITWKAAAKPKKSARRSTKTAKKSKVPLVVETYPKTYQTDVKPGRRKLKVTFDRKMTTTSWSWVGGGETYPETKKRPKYKSDKKTCEMGVMLKPGKVYWVGINNMSFRNFKCADRVPAKPYVMVFATKDKNGKATPIPERMLQQAKAINSAPALDPDAPKPLVIRTNIQTYATDVDPNITTLDVTFDQKMVNNSWSWTGGGKTYPGGHGSPRYSKDLKTCTMPVKLQPGSVYWVGVNSKSYLNFRSAVGQPAKWYAIVFSTKDKNGNPTPIPEQMLRQAKRINGDHN